ncbi:MAG: rod shape-determining protein RodA, partial [Actinomycetota bacterium]
MTATARPPSSLPRTPVTSLRRNPTAAWRHLDVVLLFTTIAVSLLGVLMVYSATRRGREDAGLDPTTFLKRQALWVAGGVVVMIAVALVDYRKFRDWAIVLYGAVILALLAVLSPLGSEIRGTKGWFEFGILQLQPAEFAKLALIVMLGSFAAVFGGELDARRLAVALGIAAVPIGLIMLQPDVGTMMVFCAIAMGVLLVGGVRPRHMVALTFAGLMGVAAVLNLGLLEEYQKERLTAFLDQEGDTQRSAYNLDQSKIAIGAGGLAGRGLFNGTQTNLSYVPEQHSDFIFTVVGEELGFAGAATLLSLFAIMAWRIWRTARLSRDLTGTLICVGVLSLLGFQVFQNVGMTMGIMPITGIPLPLVSYGGSSTMAAFAAV